MPVLDANIAQFRFEVDGLAADTFQVVRFSGVEELSHLFRFDLELSSEFDDIDFADVVNKPAVLTLMRGIEALPICGICAHFEQAARTPDAVAYRVVLVPRLWRLTLIHQSRIFQHKSVQDIVEEVLTEAGVTDFEFDLEGSYPPREYCVQYNETDFNFVCRLLEHEGICFYFTHDGDRDILVMTDARATHPPIDDERLVYRTGSGMETKDTDFIDEWVYRERVISETVQLKEYNRRTPETTLLAEEPVASGDVGVHYEYGNHFEDNGEGGRLAKLRSEEIECQRRVIQGRSTCAALRAGHWFELDEHYRKDFNDLYLVTQVVHQGAQRKAMGLKGVDGRASDDSEPEDYRNSFTCIPYRIQFRPRRLTPVPKLSGLMTAKIDSAGGDYAYIDEDGSYRGLMPFDLSGNGGGTATLPIPMAQPYSGPNYGMHFPLHENAEIIWGCIDGDLNRPVALGAAPNPSNTSPSVAQNKMQNVLRTASGNQLIMDDTIDEAFVLLNTPDDHLLRFDDKEDRIEMVSTGKRKLVLDDKGENILIQTASGHFLRFDETKDAKKITLQTKDEYYLVLDDKEQRFALSDKDGKHSVTIDFKNKKMVVLMEEGDIDIHAPKGVLDIKAKTINIESTADTTIKAGANFKAEAKSNFDGKATGNMTMEAKGNYKQSGLQVASEAQTTHDIKGLNVSSKANVKNEVSGNAAADLKASGMVTVQGGLVKIN